MGLKDNWRILYRLYRVARNDFATKRRKKPLVINMLANDICNSKCQMCYIWKQKKDIEFDPNQLGKILSDPLFSEIKHVGITGGEPTLRKDIAQLYQVCIDHLPKLTGVSIITNAIQFNQVTQRITEIKTVCDRGGVPLSAMVSLDGLNEMHDKIRGRAGNFETATRTIDFLTELLGADNVSFGCTITKDNVWNMHTFLDFIQEKGYYGRFRIAEYINRLYNEEATEKIRTFSDEEIYELTTFFMRLIAEFEKNPTYIRTYQNIIHMLNGGSRQIKCPYQTSGIVLDCRGNLQFCAPKSRTIGNSLKNSAWGLWKKNESERKRIIEEDCHDCIHDYHAPASLSEQWKTEKELFWHRILCVAAFEHHLRKILWMLRLRYSAKKQRQIFITGWYGTETVGDKAILGGIIHELKQMFPDYKLLVSTLTNTHVVEQTLLELNIKAKVVPVYSSDFARAALNSEMTILGGGPLMDMGSMAIPLWAFKLATSRNNKAVVWGCGLGPLKSEKFKKVVVNILSMASEIRLRDNDSVKMAQNLLPEITALNTGDPAAVYLENNTFPNRHVEDHYIACFIRDWPLQYSNNDCYEEFEQTKSAFEFNLAQLIIRKSKEHNAAVILYPMHTLHIGGDDRQFARYFIAKYLGAINATYHHKPTSVENIIQAMRHSRFNICMRFHSVLFASELQTDFMAIDYTLGGKIKSYLYERNQQEHYVSIPALLNSNASPA